MADESKMDSRRGEGRDIPDFTALSRLQHDLFLSFSWSDDVRAHALYDEKGNEHDLRGMAECRSHMGAESCREALDIADRQLAAGADPTGYRMIRARAHYLLREYAAAAEVIEANGGARHAAEQLLLAASCAQTGDADRAAAAVAAALASDPGLNLADLRLNTMIEVDEDIEHWLAGLAMAGVPAEPK